MPDESAALNERSLGRAVRNIKFLPFNSLFYSDAQVRGLNAREVFAEKSRYCRAGFQWYKNVIWVEKAFRWMIKIGIMRREVDGQGLTSQIRITPLGRAGIKRISLPEANEPPRRIDYFFHSIQTILINLND